MKTVIFMAAMATMGTTATAVAATSDITRTEVTHLLAAVEKSGCKFNRNGSWHDAKAASKHLQKKFEYMDRKDLLPSTEIFISKGASTSSSSGKPYQMQCQGAAVTGSGEWLTAELKRFRAAAK